MADLAHRVFIAHAAPGSKTEAFARNLAATGKPLVTLDSPANGNLVEMGAELASKDCNVRGQAKVLNLVCLIASGTAVMFDKLSWLHLSDFHYRADGDSFSQNVSCEAMKRDIPSRLSKDFPLQLIVATGDIAFSGQAREYALASEFLASLASDLGLSANRLCVVPGNHDVDRGIQTYMYEGVRMQLINEQAVDQFLGQGRELSQLMERQSAFSDFRNNLVNDGSIGETDDGLARVRPFDLDGFRVCVLELNSAWLSGSGDRSGSLLLGERQVINALNLAEEHRPHLTIALAHHPTDWLAEFDRVPCTNRLVPQLDIFHSGHLHWHQAFVMLTPGSQCLHSAAGSSHETRHYRNAYNLVEYDIGNAVCRIRQFEYRTDSGAFQELDSIEYRLPPKRELSVKGVEIADALRNHLHTEESYADYMAALLTGDIDEVPISLDADTVTFASKNLPSEYEFSEIGVFLRISNLLRVFDAVPLQDMIVNHKAAILGFSGLLGKLSSMHPEFAEALAVHSMQARTLLGREMVETPPYQQQYLDELAVEGALAELIATATRYARSADEVVQVSARRHLASALLQSDDPENRQEGLDIAFQNLDESWADSRDYRLASAAAESTDDNSCAERIVLRALEIWPGDPDLQAHCRSLALQTGSLVVQLF